eukprot:SM000030S11344  [mRNA]  locus=s30:191168:193034:- [translate_table: standard]
MADMRALAPPKWAGGTVPLLRGRPAPRHGGRPAGASDAAAAGVDPPIAIAVEGTGEVVPAGRSQEEEARPRRLGQQLQRRPKNSRVPPRPMPLPQLRATPRLRRRPTNEGVPGAAADPALLPRLARGSSPGLSTDAVALLRRLEHRGHGIHDRMLSQQATVAEVQQEAQPKPSGTKDRRPASSCELDERPAVFAGSAMALHGPLGLSELRHLCIQAYAESGAVQEAMNVLQGFQRRGFRPGRHLYRDLIEAGSQCGKRCLVLQLLEEVKAARISLSSGDVCRMTAACSKVGLAVEVVELVNFVRLSGLPLGLVARTSLIDALARVGRLRDAELELQALLQTTIKLDLLAFQSAMGVYARTSGNSNKATALLTKMKKVGIKPSLAIYNSLLRVLCTDQRPQRGWQVLKEMQASGCAPTATMYNMLIDCFCQLDLDEEAMQIQRQMQSAGCSPSRATFEALVTLHTKAGRHDQAIRELVVMHRQGLPADGLVRQLLKAHAQAGRAEEAMKIEGLLGAEWLERVHAG